MTTPLTADPAADPLLLGDLHMAGPLGRMALLLARDEIGVREMPPGSNRGPRVEVYQRGVYGDGEGYLVGQRWCGRFARWCFETAAKRLGQPRLFAGWGDLASAAKWRSQAKTHRSWTAEPAPGRVGLLVRPDGAGHVMLVAKVEGPPEVAQVVTIEGNEANQVAVRRRPAGYFSGGFVELG